MKRKLLVLLPGLVVSAMLVLNLGYVQAQIPGFIPVFVDELGNEDNSVIFQDFGTGNVGIGTASPVGALDVSRNAADALFSLSSIGAQRWQLSSRTSGRLDIGREGGGTPISITASENVGIGTTVPNNRMHIVTTGNIYPGLTVEGNATTFNGTGVTLLNRAGGNTNPWVLGTGGALGPHFFQIADSFAYRLVIDDRNGNVGIGTFSPQAKLHILAPSGEAVWAQSPNSSGVFGTGSIGVRGDSLNGAGVSGQSTSGFGVWAFSSSGYAGYFNGRVHVNGQLSKASGSFKIDHPLDPANKYLYHSFVESPDMMNLYNGVITLDERGEATVTLPEWFEVLNRDFRYQLTALGAPGPNLYIAEKVANSRFKIAGGQPGAEVSWQVTGIRQDAYANAHRILVEEDKPASERGFYLHPELHGQPEEKGIEWAQHPEMMRQMKEARPQ